MFQQFIGFGGKGDNAAKAGINGQLNAEGNHHATNAKIFFGLGDSRVALRMSFNINDINRNTAFIFFVCTQGDNFAFIGFAAYFSKLGSLMKSLVQSLCQQDLVVARSVMVARSISMGIIFPDASSVTKY